MQTNTLSPSTNGTTRLPAVLRAAKLIDRSVGYRGSDGHVTFDGAIHLEQLRDEVRVLDDKMERVDLQRKPATCHVSWKGGEDGNGAHVLHTIGPGGLSEPMRFTRNAFHQLTQKVLPGRGLTFLDALGDRCGSAGEKVAQVNMALFMRAADKPVCFRTAMLPQEDGTWARTVRGVVSTDYGDVPDRSIVDALLDTPEFAQLPILRANLTDDAMRIRLALDGNIEQGARLPMLEIWNSEVGRRAVAMRPAQFTVNCLNGLHTVNFRRGGGEYRWTHRGDPERIVQGFRDSVGGATAEARGIMDLYDRALDTRIDNIVAFLDQQLDGLMPDKVQRQVSAALNDPTTTPGNTLASAIDAITLVAQNGDDLWSTQDTEKVAGRMLVTGLNEARAGVIHVQMAEAK